MIDGIIEILPKVPNLVVRKIYVAFLRYVAFRNTPDWVFLSLQGIAVFACAGTGSLLDSHGLIQDHAIVQTVLRVPKVHLLVHGLTPGLS